MRFKNKVMIVTGAAQGIGRGIAIAAAKEGAKVVLVDKSPLVKEVAQEILNNGNEAISIISNLETLSGNNYMIEQTLRYYSSLDILINNVGGAIRMKPFEEFSEIEIIQEINRSLYPTLWGCRVAIPEMINNKSGVIVNISSIATKGIYRIPYSAAKGAVNALTASLAFEYAKHGIRINALAPGGTEAPERLIPRNDSVLSAKEISWMDDVVNQTLSSTYFKRYGSIQEQVNVALFLASDESSYITGTVLPVGGGDQG